MSWDAVGAIGEVGGAIAVFATLLYLSIQVRNSNKQSEIESLRHTWDALNQFCDLITRSEETAALVGKGRKSLEELNEDELLMFQHIHLRLLNTLESWYIQVDQTSPPGPYRTEQVENIAGVISMYLGFRGTRDLWSTLRHLFVPIAELVDQTLREHPLSTDSSDHELPASV